MNSAFTPQKETEASQPAVLLVSNLENHFCVDRRDFLSVAATGSVAAIVAPLLSGCVSLAADQIKAKAPKKVRARTDSYLYRDPIDEAQTVGRVRQDDELTVLDYKDDWLEVKSTSGVRGWIRLEHVEIIEYTQRVLPCGTPLPPGAICLCNCVPTYTCSCNPHTYRTCSCVPVCTCNLIPVYR